MVAYLLNHMNFNQLKPCIMMT